jgi:hypothetical protein
MIAIIGAILAIFVIFIIYKMRIGHLIGFHVFIFESVYDSAFKEHGAQKDALHEALLVFRTCPKFNNLSENDFKQIVDIIGDLPDPKKIIVKMIMNFDSSKALAALRDENLLRDIAAIYKKQSKNQST